MQRYQTDCQVQKRLHSTVPRCGDRAACHRKRVVGTLRRVVALATLGYAAVSGAQSTKPEAGPVGSLKQQIAEIVAAHHGEVAMYAEQLNTGETFAVDADKPLQTASTIKLALLYEAMVQVRAGKAHWDEKIVLKPGDTVGGSGMLHFFDTPLTLTLKDMLTMMVIVSDNTATNLMIDRLGLDAVNARLASLGLGKTHLYKKVFKPAEGKLPEDQSKFGLGKSTPAEIAKLMATIGECRLRPNPSYNAAGGLETAALKLLEPDAADKSVCDVTLAMLKSQFYRETVPRYLPNGGDGTVASKTGSLDAVRVDVAIVAAKRGPIVMSIFTYNNADHSSTVDNEGEVTIAKVAKAVVDAWSPDGLETGALVPGLRLPPVR